MKKCTYTIITIFLTVLTIAFSLLSIDITNQYRNLQLELTDGYSLYWATIFASIIGVLGICLTIYSQQKKSNDVKILGYRITQYEVTSKSRSEWLDNIRKEFFELSNIINHFYVNVKLFNCKNEIFFRKERIKIFTNILSGLDNLVLYLNPNSHTEDREILIQIEKIKSIIESYLTEENLEYLDSDSQLDSSLNELADKLNLELNNLRNLLQNYFKNQWDRISKEKIVL